MSKPKSRIALEMRVRIGRWMLYMTAGFSLFNCLRALLGSARYSLFSAMLPLYLVTNGCYLTGMYPDNLPAEPFPAWYLTVVSAIALLMIAVYAFCGLLSKRRPFPGLLAGAIWLTLDTLSMPFFLGIAPELIREYLIHILLIVLLFLALRADRSLQSLPPESSGATFARPYGEEDEEDEDEDEEDEPDEPEDSEEPDDSEE